MLVNMFVFDVNKLANSCNVSYNCKKSSLINKLDLILTSSLFIWQ
jgi:hypothetical protein